MNYDKKIKNLENNMRKQKETLAKLRRKAPKQPVLDYVFQLSNGRSVKLSQLFGRKKELLLVHNMGASCPYCTLWADGFNGLLPHLENRAAFAVESADKPETQQKFAAKRKWRFQMVSSHDSSFKKDLGYATRDGDPIPGISAFIKDSKGKVFRVSHSQLGPGDNYCVMWDLGDLLPASNWKAKFSY